MSIEPVVRTLRLDCLPARAFELFTDHIGQWWPLARHSLGGAEAVDVRFEPFPGGRLFEVDAQGNESVWGSVARWEPGVALTFSWHVGRSAEQSTTIDVRFVATDDGRTQLTLEHRDWHMLGAEAAATRSGYAEGWIGVLEQYRAFTTTPVP